MAHLLGELHDDGLCALVKLVFGVLLLLLQRSHHVRLGALLPVVEAVDLMGGANVRQTAAAGGGGGGGGAGGGPCSEPR